MKLSIVIPTFNNGDILHETLDSIVSQIEPDIEIIVSDNASTDNTEKVVQQYRLKYPLIKYFKNATNLGFDKNFVLSAERACGEFIWFIGDDKIAPGGIKKILEVISSFPEIGQIFVNCSMYSADFSHCETEKLIKINQDMVCENPENYIKIVTTAIGLTPAVVSNRKLWLQVDKTEIYNTGWMPFAVSLYSLPGHSSYIVADPYALYRNANFHWHKNGKFYHMLISLYKIIAAGGKYNISPVIIRNLMNDIVQPLPMNIFRAKRNGLVVSYDLIKDSISVYGKYYSFWLICLPLLILPRIFHIAGYKIYQFFKNLK